MSIRRRASGAVADGSAVRSRFAVGNATSLNGGGINLGFRFDADVFPTRRDGHWSRYPSVVLRATRYGVIEIRIEQAGARAKSRAQSCIRRAAGAGSGAR